VGNCELILVTGTADAHGYPCGVGAEFTCSDCGTQVCDLHAEECEQCQLFCCSLACLLTWMNPTRSPAPLWQTTFHGEEQRKNEAVTMATPPYNVLLSTTWEPRLLLSKCREDLEI
jgi:hypothetical protein